MSRDTRRRSTSKTTAATAGRSHAQRLAQLHERPRELARDDPDLVRVALRDLRQHLEVLVGEQLEAHEAARVWAYSIATGLPRCQAAPLATERAARVLEPVPRARRPPGRGTRRACSLKRSCPILKPA